MSLSPEQSPQAPQEKWEGKYSHDFMIALLTGSLFAVNEKNSEIQTGDILLSLISDPDIYMSFFAGNKVTNGRMTSSLKKVRGTDLFKPFRKTPTLTPDISEEVSQLLDGASIIHAENGGEKGEETSISLLSAMLTKAPMAFISPDNEGVRTLRRLNIDIDELRTKVSVRMKEQYASKNPKTSYQI